MAPQRLLNLTALVAAFALGSALPSLAHAQCEQSWQSGYTLPGMDGVVYDSIMYDIGDGQGPRLYVAGSFTLAGGERAPGIARWNGTTWEAVGGGIYGDEGGQPGTVYSLAIYRGSLYAGGSFTFVGNHTPDAFDIGYVSARGIARLNNADPNLPGWTPLASDLFSNWEANGIDITSYLVGVGPVVNAMAVDDLGTPSTADDILYITGMFDRVQDDVVGIQSGVNSIIQWNGARFTKLGGGLGTYSGGLLPTGDALAMYNGNLYVGGGRDTFSTNGFPNAGGVPGTENFAKWVIASSTWATTGYALSASPAIAKLWIDSASNTMYVSDSVLNTAPIVSSFNGTSFSQIGAIGSGLGTIRDFAMYNDGSGSKLYAAGQSTGSSSPAYSAAIQRWTGSTWETLPDDIRPRTAIGGQFYSLISTDLGSGPVLAGGGTFLAYGSPVIQNFGVFNGASWAPTPAPTKAFPGFGHANATYARKWLMTVGDEDDSGPLASSAYAFGNFFNTAGAIGASANIARLDDGAWLPLGTGPGDSIKSVVFFDADGNGKRLYAMTDGGGLRRWHGDTSTWTSSIPFGSISQGDGGNGVVFDDDGPDGPNAPAIFATGFMQVTPDPESGYRCTLAKWDGATNHWTPLGDSSRTVPGTYDCAVANFLATYNGSLYAAGTFSQINPDGSISYFGHTGVFRWTGSAWEVVGLTANGMTTGQLLASYKGKLYVAASIVGAGGSGVSAWDGSSWSGLASGVTANCLGVGSDGTGSQLFLAGEFDNLGGVPHTRNVAKWDGTTFAPLGEGLVRQSLSGPDMLGSDAGSPEGTPFFYSIASLNDTIFFTGNFDKSVAAGGVQTPSYQIAEWKGVNCCLADVTHNGNVDLEDFFAFFNCFDVSDLCADVDQNEVVDLNDFFSFLNAFDSNCE